jgi:hypothetical protein
MSKNMNNPFILQPYHSKSLFCDRQQELSSLLGYVQNNVNITLISPRRMGKTGLIYRLFEEINDLKLPIKTCYVDIYATNSLEDFVKSLSEAIFKSFPENTPTGKKFLKYIRSFRPLLSFDPITNSPQISISYQSEQEKEQTLKSMLDFLEKQGCKIVLAIDEFQQIREYPQKNVEALLRTYIQPLQNVNFIFCGSKKHLMLDIFSNVKNPFYASTQFVLLNKINKDKYFDFIKTLFTENKKKIDDDAIKFILEWTDVYTYYTQVFCNYIFTNSDKTISLNDVRQATTHILDLNEPVYLQYRAFLTTAQWKYLIAIAKEVEVEQITSNAFLSKYNIGTPSNSKRLLQSLLNKDLLIDNQTKQGTKYTIYDIFFSRWLDKEY